MIVRVLRWRLAPLLLPLVIVAASVAATAFGLVGHVRAERMHDELYRFDDGEPIEITVSEPGEHLVWVRHDDYAGPSPALLTLTVLRDGADVATRALPGDVTYQETNTAITALWAFEAAQPGTYTVTGSDINRSATFLAGAGNPQAEVQHADRWMEVGILGTAAGLFGVLVIGAILRRRHRAQPAPARGSIPAARRAVS